MAKHSDLKNYYFILGLSSGASAEEVGRAYRRLARELHPDRHLNDAATKKKFQALNEAHTVLSDAQARARYDAACIAAPELPYGATKPVTCSSCGAVSAQPRYVILWYVISLIFVTSRRAIQGVFCPSCAQMKAIQSSATTWLLGWWGLPWGPIWTVGALHRNLLNGTQPADVNGQILRRQALYFRDRGEPDLAAAVLNQALRLNTSANLRERLSELNQTLPHTPNRHLVDRWRPFRGFGFWAQLLPALALVVFATWHYRTGIIVAIAQQKLAHVDLAPLGLLAEPRPTANVVTNVRPFENFHILAGWGAKDYERVVTSRHVVGYIRKDSIVRGDGMTDLEDRCFPLGPVNLKNGIILRQTRTGPHKLKATNGLGSDAVVKLRDMSGRTALSFYVKAGDVATIDSVPEGTFMIEFANGRRFSPVCGYFLSDMSSRRFVDAETFETEFRGNSSYTSVLEITLNPVVGGKAKTVGTDDTMFDRD